MNDDERDQAITDAAADLTEALRKLYELYDGDAISVGEVLYECDKVASRGDS